MRLVVWIVGLLAAAFIVDAVNAVILHPKTSVGVVKVREEGVLVDKPCMHTVFPMFTANGVLPPCWVLEKKSGQ
jgi:hypothetical protein